MKKIQKSYGRAMKKKIVRTLQMKCIYRMNKISRYEYIVTRNVRYLKCRIFDTIYRNKYFFKFTSERNEETLK